MKKTMTLMISAALATGTLTALADGHEGGGPDPATLIEIFACSFNEGKAYGDLMEVVEDWNDWADDEDIEEYSAWTLLPYYRGPEQEFDILWLGAAPSGAALGRAQDAWLASGGDLAGDFAEVMTCNAHGGFAATQFRAPPERENRDNIVISFTDCNLAEGTSFRDLVPSLMKWAAYKGEEGSGAGMWSLMPAMGGGGETFDFKWITSYQNLETMGADFDQYAAGGWETAAELFPGTVSCDSSRVYIATNQRRAEED